MSHRRTGTSIEERTFLGGQKIRSNPFKRASVLYTWNRVSCLDIAE
jgi:hypothetical protein